MIFKNDNAARLSEKLIELGIEFKSGYFGGTSYCIGIETENPADLFKLGMLLGCDFGNVGFDKIGTKTIIAFRNALVSA